MRNIQLGLLLGKSLWDEHSDQVFLDQFAQIQANFAGFLDG
jgi:hypothetical protein